MTRDPSQTEMVSYEAFARTMLSAWDEGSELGHSDVYLSPKDAAGMAAYLATVGAKGRGTVVVMASDGDLSAQCMSFLKAFFTDQPRLAGLLKKVVGDTLHLTGGNRIVVTDDATRRPRNVLDVIALRRTAPEKCSDRDLAAAVMQAAFDNPATAAEAEKILGLEPGWFAAAKERAADESKERAAQHQAELDAMRATMQAERMKRDLAEAKARPVDTSNVLQFPGGVRWMPSAPWRE